MEEDERVLKLSDAFLVEGKADLELTVRVLNINKGHNSRLLESCQTLKEYMQFVSTVRGLYNQNIGLDNAVNRAVNYCIEHDILKEFLQRRYREVVDVLMCTLEDAREILEEENAEFAVELEKKEAKYRQDTAGFC